jgi:hypothetical protein
MSECVPYTNTQMANPASEATARHKAGADSINLTEMR